MAEQQTQPETTGPISESEAAERLSAIFAGSEESEDPEVEQPSPEETEVEEIEDDAGEAPEEPEDAEEADEGDEEADESEEGENEEEVVEDDAEDLHTVKVRGEELEVTYDELLRGYSRTEDYTRDKQALATERRESLGEYRGARDAYQKQLEVVGGLLQSMAPEAQNWEQLRTTNPQKFAEEYGRFQTFQQQINAVQGRLEAVQAEADREAAYHRDQYLKEQQELLLKLIPEWADSEVAEKEHRDLTEFMGHEYGFSPEDVIAIEDARVYQVIRDAKAYRDIKSREQSVRAKGRKAKRRLAPGAKAPQGKRLRGAKAKRKALERLENEGSEAAAFEALKAIGI